jgi:hypothetical protein
MHNVKDDQKRAKKMIQLKDWRHTALARPEPVSQRSERREIAES